MSLFEFPLSEGVIKAQTPVEWTDMVKAFGCPAEGCKVIQNALDVLKLSIQEMLLSPEPEEVAGDLCAEVSP